MQHRNQMQTGKPRWITDHHQQIIFGPFDWLSTEGEREKERGGDGDGEENARPQHIKLTNIAHSSAKSWRMALNLCPVLYTYVEQKKPPPQQTYLSSSCGRGPKINKRTRSNVVGAIISQRSESAFPLPEIKSIINWLQFLKCQYERPNNTIRRSASDRLRSHLIIKRGLHRIVQKAGG